ncbi:YdgA family protein [Alcaligenaceae bacterium]|nr:YdgA family protein [Alcaligenaceae bacterium]
MKKPAVLAGAIVFVAAAYTGVSWYVGMRAEETIRTAVERANARIVKTFGPDMGALGATLDISEYRRGVFSSDVRYTIVIQDGDDHLELGMDDRMQHGPFPWALVKQGSFSPLLAYSRSQLVDTQAVKRWFDAARGAMPLEADTRIGFGGRGLSVWRFAPLEWAMDGDRLSFSGGEARIRFSNDFRDSEGEGDFSSLAVSDGTEDETFVLKDIRLRSNASTAADDTVQVRSTLEAASFAIEEIVAEENLTVEGILLAFDSRQQASLLDASLRYDFQRVLVGDLDLGSISVGGMAARFNYEAFSALLAEYDAIELEHGAGEGEGADFELTPQDETRLLAKVAPVLVSSPEFALHPVAWRNEKGESTLSVKAAFQPLAADAAEYAGTFTEALREVNIELVLSRPMFLQAFAQAGGGASERQQLEMLAGLMFDRYISELEREGLARREGDRALTTIVYADGAVNVNGRAFSVEEFLEMFGAFFM